MKRSVPDSVKYALGRLDEMIDTDYRVFADMEWENLTSARVMLSGDNLRANAVGSISFVLKKAHDEGRIDRERYKEYESSLEEIRKYLEGHKDGKKQA